MKDSVVKTVRIPSALNVRVKRSLGAYGKFNTLVVDLLRSHLGETVVKVQDEDNK